MYQTARPWLSYEHLKKYELVNYFVRQFTHQVK